jgi:hypothetical protein
MISSFQSIQINLVTVVLTKRNWLLFLVLELIIAQLNVPFHQIHNFIEILSSDFNSIAWVVKNFSWLTTNNFLVLLDENWMIFFFLSIKCQIYQRTAGQYDSVKLYSKYSHQRDKYSRLSWFSKIPQKESPYQYSWFSR